MFSLYLILGFVSFSFAAGDSDASGCDRSFTASPPANAACKRISAQQEMLSKKETVQWDVCARARTVWRGLQESLETARDELGRLPESSPVPEIVTANAARRKELVGQIKAMEAQLAEARHQASVAGKALAPLESESSRLGAEMQEIHKTETAAKHEAWIASCVKGGTSRGDCEVEHRYYLSRSMNPGLSSVGSLIGDEPSWLRSRGTPVYLPEEFKVCYPKEMAPKPAEPKPEPEPAEQPSLPLYDLSR